MLLRVQGETVHKVVISISPSGPIPLGDESSPKGLLTRDLIKAKNQKSRVYRTYVELGLARKRFVLVTTSKEFHLKIGSLDFGCHMDLVEFLEKEFHQNHCVQLLLCIKDEAEGKEEGILVNLLTEGKETIFTFMPAH